MTTNDMIPLATTFRSNGFDFVQIARKGDHAIFRKTKPSLPLFETFEVVVIQKMGEHKWPNGNVSPAHEYMPGRYEWGTKGWSCQTLERAREKLRELLFIAELTAPPSAEENFTPYDTTPENLGPAISRHMGCAAFEFLSVHFCIRSCR